MVEKPRSKTSSKKDEEYEWEYAINKPHKGLSKWEAFKNILYDPEKKTILRRTAKGWGQLFVFYCLFYSVLAALFAICLKCLVAILSEHTPYFILNESLIGTNPGMGFRPMPPKTEEGSLIWFVASNTTNVNIWVDTINTFLDEYAEDKQKAAGLNRQICDYDRTPGPGKVCTVDVNSKSWGPCTRKTNYGYSSSSPCIFLKLNRIYGWEPEYYNDTKNLPEDMSDSLKTYIKKQSKKMLNTVWVSCHGDGPSDEEVIGPIDYYPQPGFPGYFYPYTNEEGYLSPLVAVNFKRPAVHQMINIECRVWAKNVIYKKSSMDREASVRFELLVD